MDNSYSQRAQSEVVPVMSKTTPTGAIMFGGGGGGRSGTTFPLKVKTKPSLHT